MAQQQSKDYRTFTLELVCKVSFIAILHTQAIIYMPGQPVQHVLSWLQIVSTPPCTTCHHDREYFEVEYLLCHSGEKLPSIEEVEEKDNDDDDDDDEVQDSSMDEGFIDSSVDTVCMSPLEEQDLMISVETLGDEDEPGEKDTDKQHEEEVSSVLFVRNCV